VYGKKIDNFYLPLALFQSYSRVPAFGERKFVRVYTAAKENMTSACK
jgi:hypothetical protein